MPKYFFHIDDGVSQPDTEGTELSNIIEVRAQAVAAAGEVLAEVDGQFWERGSPWRMQVTNERNLLLFTLHFSAEVPSGDVQYIPKNE